MPPAPPREPWPRRDRAAVLALVIAGAAGVVALRSGAGLWGAMGTDAPLWGLTALDLRVGAPPLVPPLYPALTGLLHRAGLGLVPAAQLVAGLGAALVPGAVAGAARAGGASTENALIAGILALIMPDLGAWSQQVQPDSLGALLLVLAGGALAVHSRAPGRGSGLALVAVATLAPLLRAHGLPLAALAVLALVAVPGGRRWAPLALAGWWLGPLLVGLRPGPHPLAQPWGDRAGGALSALWATDAEAVPYIRELHREARRAYLGLLHTGDRGAQIRWHAGRSLRLATDGWLLLAASAAAAVAGAVRRRRGPPVVPAAPLLALVLPLLVTLPALIIWSQRRHVLLAVPLALAGLAAAAPRGGGRARAGVLAGAVAVASVLVPRWPGTVAALQSERPRAEHYAALGDWVCETTPDTVLLGGIFQDVGLYCPRPRHDPDGSLADWHTALISDRPPPATALPGQWRPVHTGPGGLAVYRLVPDGGAPLPCAAGHAAPDTAHLAVAAARARWEGCAGADLAQPPPASPGQPAPPGE